MKEHEKLKIHNKSSGLEFYLVKKDHVSLTVVEGDFDGNIRTASTFLDTSQARLIAEYLLKFIYYNGEHD